MTVRELMEKLQSEDPNAVVLTCDNSEEDYTYYPVSRVTNGCYTSWPGSDACAFYIRNPKAEKSVGPSAICIG